MVKYDGTQSELHNLKSDRAEDIAKDLSKTHPEIAARLTKMVLDWNATLPTEPDPTTIRSRSRRNNNARRESEE